MIPTLGSAKGLIKKTFTRRTSFPLFTLCLTMKLFCYLLLVSLLLFGAENAHAQLGPEKIVASDLLKIQQLESVVLSPDGRFVAYQTKSIVNTSEKEHTYQSQIWLLPTDGSGSAQQLTFDRAGASQPNWHPDGERIAFVRKADSIPQIFEISIYGGEAQQLTTYEHGASAPQWAPDGKLLLFSTTLTETELDEVTDHAPQWSHERPGRNPNDHNVASADPDGSLSAIRAWLHHNTEDANPRVFTRLNLQGEQQLAPKMEFRHYFVFDTEQDIPRMVTRGYYSFRDAIWLPDSRQLILSGYPEDAGHPDRVRDRDLFLLDIYDQRTQKFLDIDGYRLSGPQIAPSGNHISFLAHDLDDPGYAQTELGIFALDGRTPPEMLTLGFDRSVSNVQWSHDNWFLFFTAPSEGGFPLFRLAVNQGKPALPTPRPEDVAPEDSLAADSLQVLAKDTFYRGELSRRTPRVERLSSLKHGIGSYDIAGGTVYYVLTEWRNPYELYASTLDFDEPRRISSHNTDWLRHKRISEPEEFLLRYDTLEVPYWVMRPSFQEPRATYPLLLEIHGGPAAMWGPGEATMWHEFQFMASHGYGVAYSNPRGSKGYGHAYKRANFQDWGGGPGRDVLAVATEVVRRNRWVDPQRQVVTGGSYAGYLTAWIIGQDHRFKAAVAQRGVYDLATFFGEGNAWRLIPNHFGGYPWQENSLLRENSPQTYVDDIRTPLLIIHADNDLRTGVIQSEVLYKSLKALRHPVEYVRYPDAGHDLSRSGDPGQRLDRLLRIYEFMERYVGHAN